jgi:hypothetical protein
MAHDEPVTPTPSQIVAQELIRQQVALHLLAKTGAGLWLMLSPTGWATTPALRSLVIGFMVYDAALAAALLRGRQPRLLTRWIIDTAELVVWAALCPADQPYSAAIGFIIPVLVILTLRDGILRGAAAAVASVAVASGLRALLHAQLFAVDALVYSGLAVVLGALLVRSLLREISRQGLEAELRADADRASAELAGRNEVIAGERSDIIDRLQTTIMRLSVVGVDPAMMLRASIAEHKRTLGERTRDTALYLRDALDNYAGAIRGREPNVARHVFFDVPATLGVLVLTRAQAAQLMTALAESRPVGHHAVERLPSSPAQLTLRIAGQVITLEAASRSRIQLSMLPVVIASLAFFTLTMSNPNYSAVPWKVTVPLAALVMAVAITAHLLIRRFGPRIQSYMALGTLVPFGLIVAVTVPNTPASADGLVTLLGPLVGLAFVLGTVVEPVMARLLAWLGFTAAAVVVALASSGATLAKVLSEYIWAVEPMVGTFFAAQSISSLGAALSERLQTDNLDALTTARGRAVQDELQYLRTVVATGESLVENAEEGAIRDHVAAELGRLKSALGKNPED